ncbi:phage holin, lambda family [Aeromonas veronii]|uniref:Phage holin, lambda family n=1 Tax=Aeromonas veronii TaxID=654 RepID=A0A3A9I5W3_AERVE|nr:phage holin, lambda family [Aeromonas veronii]RKJ83818.1 phage holin, lambda family [Aeromonas veronii]RKJ84540.1 phage holin, lambda family [Aeromonas veronii]RKJ92293.1 phage holin, lambda family [Aeromonas veronii]
MPNKDTTLWAITIAWLMDNWPAVYGALLALAISFLRITYGGGSGRRRLIEALLCGLITLAVSTGIHLIGIPQEATPLLGGMIGLLGIDIIREHSAKLLGKKEV